MQVETKAVPQLMATTRLTASGEAELGGVLQGQLYRQLRRQIPLLGAAVQKLCRLLGEVQVVCKDKQAERELARFLKQVPVGRLEQGLPAFLSCLFDQMLTYGTAVGELVLTPEGEDIAMLYVADPADVVFVEEENAPGFTLCRREEDGTVSPVPYPALTVTAALHPEHGKGLGVSLFRSLPFVCTILQKIYATVGVNWERAGKLRYAVTYRPAGEEMQQLQAKSYAETMAKEWQKAMSDHAVSDFVAVGDVQVQVIGGDAPLLDSEIPVRQMLEQIVAALGVPPFLLGLSWSATERMSTQQADILTSELESYRRMLEPSILKICRLWLLLHGYDDTCDLQWSDITLQDAVELSTARLQNARAREIEVRLDREEA